MLVKCSCGHEWVPDVFIGPDRTERVRCGECCLSYTLDDGSQTWVADVAGCPDLRVLRDDHEHSDRTHVQHFKVDHEPAKFVWDILLVGASVQLTDGCVIVVTVKLPAPADLLHRVQLVAAEHNAVEVHR